MSEASGTATHAIDQTAGSHANHQAKCPAQLTYRLRRVPLHLSDSIHMKLKTAMTLALLLAPCLASAGKLDSSCTYKGIRLQGKVKIVASSADLKVQAVRSYPDLKVKRVDSYPTSCGKWQIVDTHPDFKVQLVDHYPDLKVEFVDSFPGVR
ncbi:hypothetical protein [Burkholderia ubonensis]|uniref:hypothetical protein n=1 Tax=Burkholderia ubonensis TaxID=101571 RepID=UPI000B2B1403|nr:hypothetical protein [Burkholderia ubonensis]